MSIFCGEKLCQFSVKKNCVNVLWRQIVSMICRDSNGWFEIREEILTGLRSSWPALYTHDPNFRSQDSSCSKKKSAGEHFFPTWLSCSQTVLRTMGGIQRTSPLFSITRYGRPRIRSSPASVKLIFVLEF